MTGNGLLPALVMLLIVIFVSGKRFEIRECVKGKFQSQCCDFERHLNGNNENLTT